MNIYFNKMQAKRNSSATPYYYLINFFKQNYFIGLKQKHYNTFQTTKNPFVSYKL